MSRCFHFVLIIVTEGKIQLKNQWTRFCTGIGKMLTSRKICTDHVSVNGSSCEYQLFCHDTERRLRKGGPNFWRASLTCPDSSFCSKAKKVVMPTVTLWLYKRTGSQRFYIELFELDLVGALAFSHSLISWRLLLFVQFSAFGGQAFIMPTSKSLNCLPSICLFIVSVCVHAKCQWIVVI